MSDIVERLRAREIKLLAGYEGELQKAEAEIERLKAALSVAGLWRDMGEENKRLKAALQQIAGERDCPDYLTPSEIARAALERKI